MAITNSSKQFFIVNLEIIYLKFTVIVRNHFLPHLLQPWYPPFDCSWPRSPHSHSKPLGKIDCQKNLKCSQILVAYWQGHTHGLIIWVIRAKEFHTWWEHQPINLNYKPTNLISTPHPWKDWILYWQFNN